MTLYLVAFLGGSLAIVSPCVLPVLPFVFSRAGQPFRRSGLPLLVGMALTFAALGATSAAAGHWAIRASHLGRLAAFAAVALFGLALVVPSLGDRLSVPFVRLGGAIGKRDTSAGVGRSLLLGASTGLLWAPCAGPILGLILTGAAVDGPSMRTLWLLLSFAAGAALVLALALLAGGRVYRILRRSLPVEVWIRRGLGVAVLVAVAGIALGWDRGVLTRISLARTSALEQRLVDR